MMVVKMDRSSRRRRKNGMTKRGIPVFEGGDKGIEVGSQESQSFARSSGGNQSCKLHSSRQGVQR